VRTDRIEELLLAQILTGHYLQAKLPSTVIRGVHASLNMKHNQAHSANDLATSGCTDISTIIETIGLSFAGQIRNNLSSNHYMSESLRSVAQQYIF
jgi:hypothetical protein